MIVTAILLLIVFSVIFFVVRGVVYSNLDKQLKDEAYKHIDKIEFVNESIHFIHKSEWEQIEHKEVQLNPIFLQIIDEDGNVMDKSPNLKEESLLFEVNAKEKVLYFNTEFQGESVREVQIPVIHKGKVEGYILSAVFLESSSLVINKLRDVMLISFPLILIGLFFISRLLAGRSIQPIQVITKTTRRITENNLTERIEEPANKDELFELTRAINQLLQRIEDAMFREKQFTSDASHELRTPLSILRGTLEVLVRKERETAEYEEKIGQCLHEIDDMSEIIDSLLQSARLEVVHKNDELQKVELAHLIDQILVKYKDQIEAKNLEISFQNECAILLPEYQAMMVFDNLISNAIKYSFDGSSIKIDLQKTENKTTFTIADNGRGIKAEDLDLIMQPFYRSDSLEHKEIKGNGLGLSIAKKAADALEATIEFSSDLGKGTTVKVFLK